MSCWVCELLLRYIFDLRHTIDWIANVVFDHRHIEANPYDISLLVDVSFLHPVRFAFTVRRLLEQIDVLIHIVHVRNIAKVHANQFFFAITDHCGELAVHLQPSSF